MPGNLAEVNPAARVKGAIRARSALSATQSRIERREGKKTRLWRVVGEEEGLSNKEIDESPRSFAFVPIATPCIFDFLHATAQEMDSCIPRLEKEG